MVPSPMSSFTVDFWQNDPSESVDVICLMPNGIMITIQAHPTSTIREIKEDLWEVAKSYPLYERLKEQSMYVISAISTFANIDKFNNESKRLCDIQPYFCILLLGERDESTELSSDQELCKVISFMIGRCVDDFRSLKNPEINDFRYKMSLLGKKIENKRRNMTCEEKLRYQYPVRLASNAQLPETIKGRLKNDKFYIYVKLDNDVNRFTCSVSYNMSALQLIDTAFIKMSRSKVKVNHTYLDYILKVSGSDEYIYGNYHLIQFLYIQEKLSNDAVPTVVMQLKSTVDSMLSSEPYEPPVQLTDRTLRKHISSWKIQKPFQLQLHSIENINCDLNKSIEIGVLVGLFHGERKLCAPKKVKEVSIINDRNIEFETPLTFEIQLNNLPRMARLCLVIYEVAKSTKLGGSRTRRVNKDNAIAWVNTTVFDYKHQLKKDLLTLHTWTYADDIQSDDMFHSLGTVEPNPRTDECAVVNLTFHNYNCEETIMYPWEDAVLQHATEVARNKSLNRDSAQDTRTIGAVLAPYVSNDKLYEMHDQERNAIWAKRMDCLNDAHYELSILLHCVNWNQRDEVAEIWSLLKIWKPLPVERALELLDYAYPDPAVRSFAINCLRDLKDEELLLYLLQLVQAIKHESYLECDLVVYLLERALNNQRIGHYFFWHLRSEMQIPAIQIRFGLLLEAYLKGSKAHVNLLYKQLECLEKLKQGSELAKKGKQDKVQKVLQEFLQKERNNAVFQNTQNPLDPSYRCKGVRSDKCKVMDSKMRPLWINLENVEDKCDDIYVIFKNGDDLRQDMLTLQMLGVMDKLWKDKGLDFRMNIYKCISMERRLGMIEVVLNAETIANIQKERGMFSATSPFKKGSLYTWLKGHNTDTLDKAIQEFTLSCAGYCVATYVLGVADRHSDNIMVKTNGQLFHIDFGHILGHFKEKFGVRRERVPFVLTHDFVYVINKGRTDRKYSEEFRKFQTLCEEAFLILRKNGCLILSLFSMMISTGLPELSSEKDLKYLKETLVLDLTEDKAREHFRSKFSEALVNSWKTSLNWASHNFATNNKQ